MTSMPMSAFFHIETVAEGVYAVLTKPGQGAWGNTGIVDLGGCTVVIDTFLTAAAAAELRRAAEQLTGRSADYVLNTHRDFDHVLGNQVFADATILSTERTRADMAVRVPQIVGATPEGAQQFLASMRKMRDEATSDATRQELADTLGEWTAYVRGMADARMRLPDITFTQELMLHGTKRSARLITFGGMHTDSDAFLILPGEQIGFLGDVVQVGNHPAIRSGSPSTWRALVSQIDTLGLKQIVTGHGPVGSGDDVKLMLTYIDELERAAVDAAQSGLTDDALATIPVPAVVAHWNASAIFSTNLRLTSGTLQEHASI